MKKLALILLLVVVSISFTQAQDTMYNITHGVIDRYIASEEDYEDNTFEPHEGHIIVRKNDIILETQDGRVIQYVYVSRSNDIDYYKDTEGEIVFFEQLQIEDQTHLYIHYQFNYRVCFIVEKY